MYLDCDTTPPIRSRHVKCAKVTTAVNKAKHLIKCYRGEGQIGIYEHGHGGQFYGYVIRQDGEVYFEPAEYE